MRQKYLKLTELFNSAFSPVPAVALYPILTNNIATVIKVKDGPAWEEERQSGYGNIVRTLSLNQYKKQSGIHDLYDEFEIEGGKISAFSGRAYTTYMCHATSSGLKPLFSLLKEIFVTNSSTRLELERAKKDAIHAISVADKNLSSKLTTHAEEKALAPAAISRSIYGSIESIEEVTLNKLHAYKTKVYSRENIKLTLCGGFDLHEGEELCLDLLEQLPQNEPRELQKFNPKIFGDEKNSLKIELSENKLLLHSIFRSDRRECGDWIHAELYNTLIGRGASSLLSRQILSGSGSADKLSSDVVLYPQCSMLEISSETDIERCTLLLEDLSRVVSLEQLTDKQFDIARSKFWSELILKMSDMVALAKTASTVQENGELLDLIALREKIANMGKKELQNYATSHFNWNNHLTVIAGKNL